MKNILVAAFAFALLLTPGANAASADAAARAERNPKLLGLPANRWVRFNQGPEDGWRRESHVGMAYDSRRGVLLFHGSGTHGHGWDDSVHEFDPVTEKWTRHYAPAARETYRADAAGYRIAGRDRLLPWAMHVYDAIVYDPRLDALILASRPAHNPIRKKIKSAIHDPVWIYDLGPRRWHIMENGGEPPPVVFAGGMVYDRGRDTIVLSRPHHRGTEVWELGPDRRKWVRVWRGRQQHGINVTIEYDSRNRKIVLFGAYRPTEFVTVYTPGARPGMTGSWEKRLPTGDPCPKMSKTPVAYSEKDGVFLLSPVLGDETGAAATCVYDAGANRFRRLRGAPIEHDDMNYMMAYDPRHEVFLLVTGGWREPPIVWALRLDLAALD